MNDIIVAIITSGLGFLAVLISNVLSNKSIKDTMTASLDKHQAVQDTKIEELTREVRYHNEFAKRMPVVEEKINNLEQRIDKIENK